MKSFAAATCQAPDTPSSSCKGTIRAEGVGKTRLPHVECNNQVFCPFLPETVLPISSMRQPPVDQIRASLRFVPQVLKSLRADGEDDLGDLADGPRASGRRACSSKIQMRFPCVCLGLSTGKNPEAGRQTTQPANKQKNLERLGLGPTARSAQTQDYLPCRCASRFPSPQYLLATASVTQPLPLAGVAVRAETRGIRRRNKDMEHRSHEVHGAAQAMRIPWP